MEQLSSKAGEEMSTIGKNIRNRRTELGMTQEDLAGQIGYKSKSTINKIELGINDIPQSRLISFARALKTTPKVLMASEDVIDAEIQKNSDILVDIAVRLGSDIEFREVVKRNCYDEDFLRLSDMLVHLTAAQLESVKNMLSTFLK